MPVWTHPPADAPIGGGGSYSISVNGDPGGQGSSSSFPLGTATFTTNLDPPPGGQTYSLSRVDGDSRISGSTSGSSASFFVSGISAGETVSARFQVSATGNSGSTASAVFYVGAYRFSGS
jgi:hypothetical protein